jgi:hypothetical protein
MALSSEQRGDETLTRQELLQMRGYRDEVIADNGHHVAETRNAREVDDRTCIGCGS